MVVLFDKFLLYIPQNVHLFVAFDSEIHWFQLAQHDDKVSNELHVNLVHKI
jgi:hypothetical protein